MRHAMGWFLAAALLAGAALAGQAFAQSPSNQAPEGQPAAQQNPSTASGAATNSTTKKVYTNDDLRRMDRGDVSVVGNSRAARPGTAAANGQPKNEQYWRNRAQKLRAQMAEVDRQIAQLEAASQNSGNAPGNSTGSNPPPPSAYTVGGHARGVSGTTPLTRLRARKAQLQQEWNQFEDEARRAGVPPGWLR